MRLKRLIPRMLSVQEVTQVTIVAEDPRLFPSRDLPPSEYPGLRVVQSGPAASATAATEPVFRGRGTAAGL